MKKYLLIGLLSILGISLQVMGAAIELSTTEAKEPIIILAPGAMVMTCEQAYREYLKRILHKKLPYRLNQQLQLLKEQV